MARHERMTVGKLELASKDRQVGGVSLGAANIAGGSASLDLTTAQAVESIGTFTASHKLKIVINGTEYWIQLDAVL